MGLVWAWGLGSVSAEQRLGEVRGDCVLRHVLYVQHRVVRGRLGGGALVRVRVRVRVRVKVRVWANITCTVFALFTTTTSTHAGGGGCHRRWWARLCGWNDPVRRATSVLVLPTG